MWRADAAPPRPAAAAGKSHPTSPAAAAASAAAAARHLPLSTFHWHQQAVGALAFTPDAAYLLSGGAEAVLVLWQLASGTKQFLPRLGGPLRSFDICPSDPALARRARRARPAHPAASLGLRACSTA